MTMTSRCIRQSHGCAWSADGNSGRPTARNTFPAPSSAADEAGLVGLAGLPRFLRPRCASGRLGGVRVLPYPIDRDHQAIDDVGFEQCVGAVRTDVCERRLIEPARLDDAVFGQFVDDQTDELDLVCREPLVVEEL